MKKTLIFLSLSAMLLGLCGCASKGDDLQKTVEDQKQQIEALTNEKKQLESLLQARSEKSPVRSSESSEPDPSMSEDLEELFTDFIHAEFELDHDTLSDLTTAAFYTILTDTAGEAETDLLFQSTVKSIDVYKVEQTDDTAAFVGKIKVETKVGDYAPNTYEQLIELTAERNSEGVFQVDSQLLTTLAQ